MVISVDYVDLATKPFYNFKTADEKCVSFRGSFEKASHSAAIVSVIEDGDQHS